jgi:hypothetical protein
MVYLGTYNASAEQMDLSLAASSGSILSAATPASMDPVSALLDHGIVYDWAAAGNAADGRLLIIAKLDCGNQAPSPCDTFVSLVRELRFDHATAQLVSRPVEEYTRLRNHTYVKDLQLLLPKGLLQTLPLPAGAGGALDLLLSWNTSGASVGRGFGIAIRAPNGSTDGAAVVVNFTLAGTDTNGTSMVHVHAHTAPLPKTPTSGIDKPHPPSGGVVIDFDVLVLPSEALDVRVLIDRPVVEVESVES